MSYIKTQAERESLEPEVRYRRRDEERVGLRHVLKPFTAWLKAFSKPYTVPFKASYRAASANYRGWHVNKLEQCIGCGSCAQICMNVAVDMVAVSATSAKDTGLRPRFDYGRCCWCGLCVDICPTASLGMSDQYLWSGSDPEEFRFTPGVDKKPWDPAVRGWRKLRAK